MKPADYKLTQNDEKKLGVFLKNTTHIIMDALNENISLKLIHSRYINLIFLKNRIRQYFPINEKGNLRSLYSQKY